MAVFKICKGAVIPQRAYQKGGNGVGAFKVEGLETGSYPTIVQDVQVGGRDIVTPLITLEDVPILQVFGRSWNQVTIECLMFLGEEPSRTGAISALKSFVDSKRVSNSSEPLRVSTADEAFNFYLFGYNLGKVNHTRHLQNFSLIGVTHD